MAELLHLAWASRSALISTCSFCNENSMFAFPVSMSNGAIIQSGTVMLSRDSETFFIIDPVWNSLMPHRPPMDFLVSQRPPMDSLVSHRPHIDYLVSNRPQWIPWCQIDPNGFLGVKSTPMDSLVSNRPHTDYLVSHRPQWIPWCHIDP
ncbi:hypothetical protein T02_1871 [Trichinella nativa]|uniref:Uncharacterized protein n=1 Tax=Trichinella nativa TaxID=6335 RepID=A0A0V1KMS6_9BILA|nr:hypothetical protein T02_1871 [Trichinella nativa]